MAVHPFPSEIHPVPKRRRRHHEDGEDRVEQRAAIDSSRDIVSLLGDATTRQAFEAILTTEEAEHPDEWLSFLEELGVRAPTGR